MNNVGIKLNIAMGALETDLDGQIELLRKQIKGTKTTLNEEMAETEEAPKAGKW